MASKLLNSACFSVLRSSRSGARECLLGTFRLPTPVKGTRNLHGFFSPSHSLNLPRMSTPAYMKGSPNASKVILPLHSSQWPRQFFSSRFAANSLASSTSSAPASGVVANLPVISPPAVSNWLLLSSALVFGIIVVGGVTRLTESGLSITEWKPITGILPPLSQEEWQAEFDKYKLTPEFKLLNHQITLSEFKRIFFWEYTHRVLGRVIGLGFVVPYAYFLMKKRLTPSLPAALGGLGLLIGFQGALGWYMVKSGLEDSLMHTPGAVPRVSQYRLAAHLGTAFVLFAGMLGIGLGIRRDWKWANGGTWSGLASFEQALASPALRRFKGAAWGLLGLVFVTALSGAFVAGLDAGLLYNEFPLMGGRLAPPSDELFSPAYCQQADHSDKWWRNLLENPTTVQFDHRVLAMTTYASTLALWVASLRTPNLPPLTRHLARTAFTVANVQVLLGISTLLYLVPIPLAAAHQAGSVALLTAMVGLVGSLRRPGQAARLWREARALGKVVKSQ